LQTDPDMQLMYDRLKRVSDQLALLPLVTPRFSIVDSILPQLGAAGYEAASLGEAPAIPKLQRRELKNNELVERKKWKKVPVWVTRAGSGIVAACLLLGMFFAVNGTGNQSRTGSNPETLTEPATVVQH
ncbi:hypothetical protein MXD81_23760, partial [Microbacteriaceae bacterium K1510]|nr:hypothetical protein [Microbacteriaceae bacterium K1510]